jgi:hypothetical protein
MDYGRGDEQVWVSGGLRVRAGQDVTFTAPARHTVGDFKRLTLLEAATPEGELTLVSDNRSSHTSGPSQQWLGKHPRVHPVRSRSAPAGSTCRQAGGGSSAARRSPVNPAPTPAEIALATRVATDHLNARAHPCVWGRPPPPHRTLCRHLIYLL